MAIGLVVASPPLHVLLLLLPGAVGYLLALLQQYRGFYVDLASLGRHPSKIEQRQQAV